MKSWADDPMDAPEAPPPPPRAAPQQSKPPEKKKDHPRGNPNRRPAASPKPSGVSDTMASPSWQKRAAAAVQRQKQLEENIREQRVKNTSAARSWRTPQKTQQPPAVTATAMPTPAQAQAQAQAQTQAKAKAMAKAPAQTPPTKPAPLPVDSSQRAPSSTAKAPAPPLTGRVGSVKTDESRKEQGGGRGRDLGVIAGLKESFGFIQCKTKELPGDVYFHFTQVSREEENLLKLGDEVEFEIEEASSGRVSALRVKRLPKGTIKVDEEILDKQDLVGVIVRTNTGTKPSHGRIVLCTPSELKDQRVLFPELTDEELTEPDNTKVFAYSDKDGVAKPGRSGRIPFAKGAIVGFGLVKAIATGKTRAAKIKVMETGHARAQQLLQLQADNAPVETGKIHSIAKRPQSKRYLTGPDKHLTGMLKSDAKEDPIPFSYAALAEDFYESSRTSESVAREDWRSAERPKRAQRSKPKQRLYTGLPVQFVIVKSLQDDREVAIRIQPLSESRKDSALGKSVSGTLAAADRIDLDTALLFNEKDISSITFTSTDCPAGPKPEVKDKVKLDVVVSSSSRLEARRVYLLLPGDEAEREGAGPFGAFLGKCRRETGKVASLKESFGFIDCFDRDLSIFFPYNEVVAAPSTLAVHNAASKEEQARLREQPPLKVGEPVSFFIRSDKFNARANRAVASRVCSLADIPQPPARVQLLEEDVQGRVVEIPMGSSSRARGASMSKGRPGRIQFTPTRFVYPELLERLKGLGKGEKVLFFTDKSKMETHADQEGEAARMYVSEAVKLLLRPYSSWLGLRLVVIKGEDRKPIGLEATGLGDGVKDDVMVTATFTSRIPDLRRSDTVAFTSAFDKKQGQLVALNIRVVESANEEEEEEKDVSPIERRDGTETGVIACVTDQGFGFVQGIERPLRLYFHFDQCPSDSFRTSPTPGYFVEFFPETNPKGERAVKLKRLALSQLKIDEIENEETQKGFITREPREPKPSGQRFHPLAMKVAAFQGQGHVFGKIVVGFHDPNDPAKQRTEPEPLDWRRENELRKIVRVFEESNEPWRRLESDHDSRERKVIRKEAQSRGLRSLLDSSKKLVVARTEAALTEYRNEHEDMSSDDGNDPTEAEAQKTEVKEDVPQRESATLTSYFFSSYDIVQPAVEDKEAGDQKGQSRPTIWVAAVGDEVEFSVCKNIATKRTRATNIRLVSSASRVQRGFIDGVVKKVGFVRPAVAGEGSKGLYSDNDGKVDESFKPGFGGRDGTVRFDITEIVDNVRLFDGDEVEYVLVINSRTKEAKAVRVRLVNRAQQEPLVVSKERRKYNQDLLLKMTDENGVGVARFHQAKAPDGTNGFPAGRGRSLKSKVSLNVTANVFTPSFLKST